MFMAKYDHVSQAHMEVAGHKSTVTALANGLFSPATGRTRFCDKIVSLFSPFSRQIIPFADKLMFQDELFQIHPVKDYLVQALN